MFDINSFAKSTEGGGLSNALLVIMVFRLASRQPACTGVTMSPFCVHSPIETSQKTFHDISSH